MNILLGNYGNHTIALIQWAHEHALSDVTVVNINTQWAAKQWPERVKAGQDLSIRYGFAVQELEAPSGFADLAKERGRLPSAKFQWCTTFLKAMPLLSWLDEVDPSAKAVIYMGSRREDSRARYDLPPEIPTSEHFGDRKVIYPLFQHQQQAFIDLIEASGLPVLTHPSQECAPCIHSHPKDIEQLCAKDQNRWLSLLKQVASKASPICNKTPSQFQLESFDRGCGSFYACGE